MGLEQRTPLLFDGAPSVMNAESLSGAGLPPFLPDHHSVEPNQETMKTRANTNSKQKKPTQINKYKWLKPLKM